MSKTKRSRRGAFATAGYESTAPNYDTEMVGGVFAFFRDFGVRETIESIVIAIILALLFRTYEAEAFIIPTGSMAPSLQGQHMDVYCAKCEYKYRTGASGENSTVPSNLRKELLVTDTHCPICNYEMHMRRAGTNSPKQNPDHESNNGDRILVNKFIYDFSEPKRFDVIVFKNPNNGKQNYIKRLVGLPGETLRIENGDIFSFDEDGKKQIVRKPPNKVRVMLQLVDDTKYIAEELTAAGWPLRWQQWSQPGAGWESQTTGKDTEFVLAESEKMDWLNYRHLRPEVGDWEDIEGGTSPLKEPRIFGQLITDYYCYNDAVQVRNNRNGAVPGSHWVGDLAMECELVVKSSSGTVAFRLVEGGTEFVCSSDVATGAATIQCENPKVAFSDSNGNHVETPTASTNLKGAGTYSVAFANVDDSLFLWINNRLAKFDAPTFERAEIPVPKWSASNAGDAEPLGVGGQNVDLLVKRLKVKRDIYYTSAGGTNRMAGGNIESENGFDYIDELKPVFQDPTSWSTPDPVDLFSRGKGLNDPMFFLEEDQFLPMGDNSPQSLDGRVWDGERFLHRDYLLGRAMLVYWPHTLNSPVPFLPNFGEMRFIK